MPFTNIGPFPVAQSPVKVCPTDGNRLSAVVYNDPSGALQAPGPVWLGGADLSLDPTKPHLVLWPGGTATYDQADNGEVWAVSPLGTQSVLCYLSMGA